MDRFQKRKETKIRRQSQTCKVFELKIDHSKLPNKTREKLHSLFVEAKWFYNYCLSLKDINDADTTAKSVQVKVKDTFEERKFTILSGAMKQAIKTRLFSNLKALSELKKKGHKVGRLKFKSRVESIPLQQYKKTHKLDWKNNRIKIQNVGCWTKVRGLKQISQNLEIANANLLWKPTGYYLHITAFESKEPKNIPERAIGIDFGCETQMTFSDGTKVEFQVPASKRLRRLDRRIDKKVNGVIGKHRGSKNRRRLQRQRRKEYERITNQKADIRNKIVSAITKNFKYVVVQNESIHAWHASNHGKKIQNTGIGAILSDLKHKSDTPIVVDKFFPSTQLCPQCGKKNKLTLADRTYNCECGYTEDRDIKSAKCILIEGLKTITNIPTDYREFTLEEKSPSTVFDLLMKINNIKVSKENSLSQEAAGIVLR